MKRQRIELAELVERSNLALAACKAARGKRRRRAVAAWLAQADERLAVLGRSIVDGSAPQGRATRFVIHDPKLREISAACFDDRVLHHAVMNLAADRFERALADSVYACRPGKGVHAAVAAVQRGLQRWPWVVQVDVAGYFASIDHAVLQAQLARLFKGAGFMALLARIIRSGHVAAADADAGAAACGLPIGALTSQYFANHYLATADRLLLALPGVRAHVRYMDDIVWFTESRVEAHASLAALRTHLAEALHLQLKPGAQPRPSRPGLAFCGFRVRPGVVLASRRKLARARQQMRRLQRARRQGVPGKPRWRLAQAFPQHRAWFPWHQTSFPLRGHWFRTCGQPFPARAASFPPAGRRFPLQPASFPHGRYPIPECRAVVPDGAVAVSARHEAVPRPRGMVAGWRKGVPAPCAAVPRPQQAVAARAGSGAAGPTAVAPRQTTLTGHHHMETTT